MDWIVINDSYSPNTSVGYISGCPLLRFYKTPDEKLNVDDTVVFGDSRYKVTKVLESYSPGGCAVRPPSYPQDSLLLLESDDVNTDLSSVQYPIAALAHYLEHTETLKHVLNKVGYYKLGMEQRSAFFRRAMVTASSNGNVEAVKILKPVSKDLNCCLAVIVNLVVKDFSTSQTTGRDLADRLVRVAEFLVEEGATFDGYDPPLIISAARNGNHTLVEFLIQKGCPVHKNSISQSMECLIDTMFPWSYDHICRVLELLVNNGANINSEDGLSLRKAFVHNRADIVKWLLDHGANPKIPAVVKRAVKSGFTIFSLLVERGMVNHENYDSALNEAMKISNNHEIVRFLFGLKEKLVSK